MVRFTATIKKFASQGEKTGWTYIDVPAEIAGQMVHGNKKGFRVKGSLDEYQFEGMSLLPMGGGNFILTLNAAIRKGIGKLKGAQVKVVLEVDENPILPPTELLECLADEPTAQEYFNKLNMSHRNYFIKWIDTAKTEATKAKRIALSVNALAKGWDYGTMIRAAKQNKDDLLSL